MYGTTPPYSGSTTSSSASLLRPRNSSTFRPAEEEDAFPPYAELPFTSLKRRQYHAQNEQHKWIKWIMRGILASPLVVLVLWVGVLHPGRNAGMRRVPKSMKATTTTAKNNNVNWAKMQSPQAANANLPFAIMQNGQPVMQQVMQQGQQVMQQGQPQMQQAQPVMQQGQQVMQQGQPVMQAAQPIMQQGQPVMQQGQQVMQMPQQQAQQPKAIIYTQQQMADVQQEQAMQEVAQDLQNAPPQQHLVKYDRESHTVTHEGKQKLSNNGVYFYDPQESLSEAGVYQLPQTVYDAQGKPMSLQALQQSGMQIVVQPPPSKMSFKEATKQLEESFENRSNSQDQSIIVGTVAVMALLVGALSARRLRAKSILSACIENEPLDIDGIGSSRSMPSQRYAAWKGDLEKFDV